MYRTHTCGQLRLADAGAEVTLSGWVQRVRKLGGMTFVDLRDRYGITQLAFDSENDAALCEQANSLGREYVIQVDGKVIERTSKNSKLATGDIEIAVSRLTVLNSSEVPPFTIEDNTDGGDDIRMKYRYLDLRRSCVSHNLLLRHRMTMEIRRYLDSMNFVEIETPVLIGSTPEGAHEPGPVLRPAAEPADVQAAADGGRIRPLLPDSQVLPRRRPPRRPSARIHPDRLRDELRGAAGRHRPLRRHGQASVQNHPRHRTHRALHADALERRHAPLRQRQARPALRNAVRRADGHPQGPRFRSVRQRGLHRRHLRHRSRHIHPQAARPAHRLRQAPADRRQGSGLRPRRSRRQCQVERRQVLHPGRPPADEGRLRRQARRPHPDSQR